MRETLRKRTSLLEKAFFHEEEAKQLEAMRAKNRRREQLEALREASGLTDDGVLNRLVELEISAETVSALALIPLVAVAWADGEMQEREREAILNGAAESGIEVGTDSHDLLKSWLRREPGDELLSAWEEYVRDLGSSLDDPQRDALRTQMVGRARAVAQSAGGFLGLAAISAKEEAVLGRLHGAFAG